MTYLIDTFLELDLLTESCVVGVAATLLLAVVALAFTEIAIYLTNRKGWGYGKENRYIFP